MRSRTSPGVLIVMAAAALLSGRGTSDLSGQAASTSAEAAAPIDLTGYWVSIITEDWRWRMMTPPKGDYSSLPLSSGGRKVADTWDPARDEKAGEQCKSYGAAAIMRVPGRLRITWENENTLKIETDAGQQTRLLHFGGSPQAGADRALQGRSAAEWQTPPAPPPVAVTGAGRVQEAAAVQVASRKTGSLKVVTTEMRPGYLRKNGVPYSENATLTEYFDRVGGPNNGQWLIVTTIVEDPTYLTQPFVTSSNFRREPDGSKWLPSPCTSR
jgi:hypothetical protein